ncbi:ABC transporter ATP-binding protein [Candidatus Leptofilum sp.]|uniref:ABC transporter ATP-binding protein n=1 Tax=Candidatus Leptofilum sp. TaxID=3241576 RepID=UPI003B5A62C7
MNIIEVTNLQKHFSVRKHFSGRFGSVRSFFSRESTRVRAVDGISFGVEPGELVGYLGPNGAGKSTTIKMLTGLLVPSGGDVVVNGRIPHQERQQYVARIGVVFGQRTTLWWDLPVIESLELLRHVYQIPTDLFRQNLAEFTEMLEMEPFLHTPVRSLSLGQRMRADIAAALLHNPDLLFLDEPTIGLDVVAKERIRQFIQHVNAERGTTVLLTTHDLADVQRLCQRVMIIDRGKLLFDGRLQSLQNQFGGKRELVVDFAQDYEAVAIEGATVINYHDSRATYQFRRGEISASELIGRISSQYRVQDLAVREPDIEGTIRRIYEEKLLEKE